MFGLTKRETIEEREIKRIQDECYYRKAIVIVEKCSQENTFKPNDKFCPICGLPLHQYTIRISYNTQTGQQQRIVYMGCKQHLPYNIEYSY